LSTVICAYICLTYNRYNTLKVCCFGDSQLRRMVFCLSSVIQNSQNSVGILCGGENDLEEIRAADMVGTGAGHKQTTALEHLQGPQIQLLISSQGGAEVRP
jgi:hypothetical protein